MGIMNLMKMLSMCAASKIPYELMIYFKNLITGTTCRQILGATITIGALTLIVQFIGLAKEMLVAAHFGTSDVLDAFLIAMVIPTFLINIIAGSFQSALIPIYVRVRNQEGDKAAQDLFGRLTVYCGAFLLLVLLFIALSGHLILPLLASGFLPQKLALTQTIFYWVLPVIAIQGMIVIWSAVLNAYGKFALAAITPVFLPLITMISLISMGSRLGVFSLVIGTIGGYVLQLAVIGFGLRKQGLFFRLRWEKNNAQAREMMGQYIPIFFGATLMSGTLLVDQAMAAALQPGSLSALNYGSRLVTTVLGLTAASIGTAAFPYFSKQVADKDWGTLVQTLHRYLRWIFGISVPISLLICIFSEQIIRPFYERGAFLPEDTYLVAQIQSFLIFQIPFYMGGILLVRVISSLQANKVLIWVSGLNLLLKIIMNYMFMKWLGVLGIALSTSIMFLGSFTLVYIFVKISFKRLFEKEHPHD